jgi:hypothetical protein
MKKLLLYTKITYILKVLLNVVITGIEALIVLGNKFLFIYLSKKSAACELSHVLTPSTNSLLLKSCDLNQFFR